MKLCISFTEKCQDTVISQLLKIDMNIIIIIRKEELILLKGFILSFFLNFYIDWIIVADILVPDLCVDIPVTFHELGMMLLTIKRKLVLYWTGNYHIIPFFSGT